MSQTQRNARTETGVQIPSKYQPDPRLIDDPEELCYLYCTEGLAIREIAQEYSDNSYTAVYDALDEYGIRDEPCTVCGGQHDHSGGDVTGPVGASERGFDPPVSVDWSEVET